MPSKNIIKQYVAGGFYHVYNRGVDKRTIFEDEKDYTVFLRFLKEYLLPIGHPDLDVLSELSPRRFPINCHEDIELLAYCLMPNHFHLFIKQKTADGLQKFIRALATNYVMYFNRKYSRVGPLFQSRYKAALIKNEPYFVYITGYIHANPAEMIARDGPLQSLEDYKYSSYPIYLGRKKADWVNPNPVLSIFDKDNKSFGNSYQNFVEGIAQSKTEEKIDLLSDLMLE